MSTADPGVIRSRLLFVAGGEDVMRAVFETHGFGYWSAAFDILLEKHGWIDFHRETQEVLAQPETLWRYGALIVAWLPEAFWKPEYVDGIRRFNGTLFLEGPLPEAVRDLVGLRAAQPERTDSARLEFSPRLRNALARLEPVIGGPASSARLAPKAIETKPTEYSREEFHRPAGPGGQRLIEGAAISHALALEYRFETNGVVFPDPLSEAHGTLAFVRFVGRLVPGRPRDRLVRTASEMLAHPPPPTEAQTPERSAIIAAIRAAARAQAADAREWPDQAPVDPQLIPQDARSPLEVAAWQTYAAAAQQQQLPALSGLGFALDAGLAAARGATTRAWLLQSIESFAAAPGTFAELTAWLEDVSGQLERTASGVPPSLEGWGTIELGLLCATLTLAGRREHGLDLFGRTLGPVFDRASGFFPHVRVEGGEVVQLSGDVISPLMLLALLDMVADLELADPAIRSRRGYSDRQIERWARAPYWVEHYNGRDGRDEIALLTASGTSTGVWSRGPVLASSFQVLARIVHEHTLHPLPEPLQALPRVDAMLLEHALFELLASAVAENDALVVRVEPWPWDAQFAFTIRHDVDRIPTATAFDRLLSLEVDAGAGVTWFWIPHRIDHDQLRRTAAAGHENALHALRLTEKDHELADLAAAIPDHRPIAGEALHGGGGGDRWLGHPSVRAAVRLGLRYTEAVPAICDFPYTGFPTLTAEGIVEREDIVSLTYSATTDPDPRRLTVNGTELGPLRDMAAQAAAGLYCQVLNHPDMNFELLAQTIAEMPNARANMTCEQAARWWRTTHTRAGLLIGDIEYDDASYALELVAAHAVRDVAMRLPIAAERVRRVTLGGRDAEWEARDGGIRVRVALEAQEPVRLLVLHDGGAERSS